MSNHDDHALPAACRLIGDALGVPITMPPDAGTASATRDRLADIARTSRIRTRRVLLSGEWWRRSGAPLLAYREGDKQAVVLLPRSRRRYELVDPLSNHATAVNAEVAQTLVAHAVSFYRPLPQRALDSRGVLRFGMWGSGNEVRSILLLTAASGLLALVAPFAAAALAGTVLAPGPRAQLLLLGMALAMAALAVAGLLLLRASALVRLQGRLTASLQAALWDRLLNMPLSFFRSFGAGELVGRGMGIDDIRPALGTLLGVLLSASFSLVSLALLFLVDAALALLVLVVAVFGAIVAGVLASGAIRRQRSVSALDARGAGLALQCIAAIAKLRVAGAEGRALARWQRQIEAKSRALYRAELLGNALAAWRAAYPIGIMAALLAAIAFGGLPTLELGELLAFAVAAAQFVAGSLLLSTALPQLAGSSRLYRRVAPIVHAAPELEQTGKDPGVLRGAIDVAHVSFRYSAAGPSIINDVSLHIQPGETVAIVGPSGCGKSTLVRLLLGFERPDAGHIVYDGRDLATLDLRDVRRQLGVVLQHGTLMADTILNNIVGSSLAPIEQAWQAARLAGIDDEIRQLPMGMHTLLAEGGATLSGGQRQRLLIARALVHRPRILFFDEATSALDNTTQAIVTQSIAGLAATRVLIAHRLSTVRHADRIYVLDRGSVVQSGTYAELLEQDGLFARLARRQIA